jgi:phage tail-like protein
MAGAFAMPYPYRTFRYQVEIDGITRAGFSEVSGMNASIDPVEYREGNDMRNTPRKFPGLTKFGNVTLRWGVSNDTDFVTWLTSVAPSNSAAPTGLVRHSVTITLFDDAGNPGPSWALINAWPVGYTVPDLSGLGSEVAIQSLELAHEGLEHTPGATLAGTAATV